MSELGEFLNRLHSKWHRVEFLSSDPLEFVRKSPLCQTPLDQEAVALLSALLAYGNVRQIRASVEDALNRIAAVSGTPAGFVRSLSRESGLKKAQAGFKGFVHRFNRGPDLVLLFRLLGRSWQTHGSLGGHFLKALDPGAADISAALDSLIADWRNWAKEWGKPRGYFDHLLTAPADGSCCKRWCMFLRWMGRKDELDPGLWTEASALSPSFPLGRSLRPDQLVIPLDTHTGRISQYLGLTGRKTLNWQAALEVTRALKACDPSDPTRFDFALSRLGILDFCKKRYRAEICGSCDLFGACQFAQKRVRSAKCESDSAPSDGPSPSMRS